MNFSEYANNEAAFLRLRVVPSEKALPLRGPLPVCRGRTLFRGNIDSDSIMHPVKSRHYLHIPKNSYICMIFAINKDNT